MLFLCISNYDDDDYGMLLINALGDALGHHWAQMISCSVQIHINPGLTEMGDQSKFCRAVT